MVLLIVRQVTSCRLRLNCGINAAHLIENKDKDKVIMAVKRGMAILDCQAGIVVFQDTVNG